MALVQLFPGKSDMITILLDFSSLESRQPKRVFRPVEEATFFFLNVVQAEAATKNTQPFFTALVGSLSHWVLQIKCVCSWAAQVLDH
jgi:hypothetical protein